MPEWAHTVDKKCLVHGRRMIIAMSDDNEPKREGSLIKVECPIAGCSETSTVSEYQARDDRE